MPRIEAGGHRLDALALAGQQQAGAIAAQRIDPVGVTDLLGKSAYVSLEPDLTSGIGRNRRTLDHAILYGYQLGSYNRLCDTVDYIGGQLRHGAVIPRDSPLTRHPDCLTNGVHLKGRFPENSKISFSMAVGLISALAPLQVLLGDLHGLTTLHHQPTKVAAMEGHWEGGAGAPLILFSLPDMEAEENHYEIAISYLSSLILTHELEGKVPGLKDVPSDERPYMPIVFWAFRLMVGLGFVMLGVGLGILFPFAPSDRDRDIMMNSVAPIWDFNET